MVKVNASAQIADVAAVVLFVDVGEGVRVHFHLMYRSVRHDSSAHSAGKVTGLGNCECLMS